MGRYEKAIGVYDKLSRINGDYAQAWFKRGDICQKLGRKEEAIKSYEKAIELQPDYPEALENKNRILEEFGRYEYCLLYTSPSPRDQ